MENETELEKISRELNEKKTGCTSCEVVSINGVACHETGCPDSWKDPVTGKGYKRECKWCGTQFEPEDRFSKFCDVSCLESYYR